MVLLHLCGMQNWRLNSGPCVGQANSPPEPHLEGLVLPAQLLHGRGRVVQLPLQLQDPALQLFYVAFPFKASYRTDCKEIINI